MKTSGKTQEPAAPAYVINPRAKSRSAAQVEPAGDGKVTLVDFAGIYQLPVTERIALIRRGVPARDVKEMVRRMGAPQDAMLKVIRLPVATVNRKASRDETLSLEESERAIGMSMLIGQVEAMVAQSGDAAGFDAARWLAHWLEEPNPALGNQRPADYMDTAEGFGLVARVLAAMQGGSYL
ncbi:antitoxin Xre-like helix-turn-helix domain-containing protein [Chitinimonas koreensis]|uniref:antitoxin Xre-like helix-turn-helix domain-containing protein n=1 Tax=Chitinimonas koreensis TaxID=356302 RepID=UPI00040C62D0|nr:antitoxin Xre-like helix-turn-helix domain-containing protein [Chitinimonas koreensis]QNM97849.1 DUF2384 domain-containing protein [Chitinimonas koreensis]